MSKRGNMESKHISFEPDVWAHCKTKDNLSAYVRELIRKDIREHGNSYVINLVAFNNSSKKKVLDMLMKEGVPVKKIYSQSESGVFMEVEK